MNNKKNITEKRADTDFEKNLAFTFKKLRKNINAPRDAFERTMLEIQKDLFEKPIFIQPQKTPFIFYFEKFIKFSVPAFVIILILGITNKNKMSNSKTPPKENSNPETSLMSFSISKESKKAFESDISENISLSDTDQKNKDSDMELIIEKEFATYFENQDSQFATYDESQSINFAKFYGENF